ncbi:MAG: CHAT domain-containing protein, partial [Bacteroidota bacterium]
EYPAYYQTKYSFQTPTIAQVQAYLGTGQMLFEYYWGDNDLYVFRIQKSELELQQLPIDPKLETALVQCREFLGRPTASEAEMKQFQVDAHYLYTALIDNLPDGIESLILVPDGPLAYLPFDILLSQASEAGSDLRYHELPYLLKTHRLYYQYSSALLLEEGLGDQKASIAYGGFAPTYPASPNASRISRDLLAQPLAQLAFTKEEVQNTQKIFGGQVRLGEEATKARFLQEASEYELLHLAMHGLLSGEKSEFAALAFFPDSDSAASFLLSTNEIAAMELKARLVVLSACETGGGRLQRGEGVMSMGRAFREAGVPNVLMSLWTADDKSATILMQDFFARLQQGSSVAESIREAKLSLMKGQLLQSHPYYWAGFVPLGNPDQNGRSPLLPLSILLFVAVAGIGFAASSAKPADNSSDA